MNEHHGHESVGPVRIGPGWAGNPRPAALGGAFLLAGLMIGSGARSLPAQASPTQEGSDSTVLRSIWDGVYTHEQARRGEEVSLDVCSECHTDEDFTDTLMESWAGGRLSDLFDQIVNTMPEDSPGALRLQDYADVLAFILELNGAPPGEQELATRMADLADIIFEPPKEPSAEPSAEPYPASDGLRTPPDLPSARVHAEAGREGVGHLEQRGQVGVP